MQKGPGRSEAGPLHCERGLLVDPGLRPPEWLFFVGRFGLGSTGRIDCGDNVIR